MRIVPQLLIVALVFWYTPAHAQDEVAIPADLAPEFHRCHALLNSEPLNTLSEFVEIGRGAMISDRDFGKALVGVKCSELQIVSFMKHHGFVHFYTKNLPEPREHVLLGPYNKVLSFSTRSRNNWIHRKLYGEYEIGARFMMLENTILRIASAAHK